MKNILYVFVLSIFAGTFYSCEEDESLVPTPPLVDGLYARLDITNKVLNIDDPENSYFGGPLTSPSGRIVEYKLYVKRRDAFGTFGDFALVKTITSFPTELKIFRRDIAAALGLTESSLLFGEEYYFYAEAFDAEGNRANWYSLSAVVQTAVGLKNAFRFRTTLQNQAFFDQQVNLDDYDNYVNP